MGLHGRREAPYRMVIRFILIKMRCACEIQHYCSGL